MLSIISNKEYVKKIMRAGKKIQYVRLKAAGVSREGFRVRKGNEKCMTTIINETVAASIIEQLSAKLEKIQELIK